MAFTQLRLITGKKQRKHFHEYDSRQQNNRELIIELIPDLRIDEMRNLSIDSLSIHNKMTLTLSRVEKLALATALRET